MIPPAITENKYRETQPYIIQRVRDLEILSSTWDVFITSLPSEFREPCCRGCRKNGRARGDGGHQKEELLHIVYLLI